MVTLMEKKKRSVHMFVCVKKIDVLLMKMEWSIHLLSSCLWCLQSKLQIAMIFTCYQMVSAWYAFDWTFCIWCESLRVANLSAVVNEVKLDKSVNRCKTWFSSDTWVPTQTRGPPWFCCVRMAVFVSTWLMLSKQISGCYLLANPQAACPYWSQPKRKGLLKSASVSLKFCCVLYFVNYLSVWWIR